MRMFKQLYFKFIGPQIDSGNNFERKIKFSFFLRQQPYSSFIIQIDCLLKLSMRTQFSDNNIIDPNATTQQTSLKNIPMMPALPLRLSYSPQKPRVTKKFFFPIRNKSTKNDQFQAKKQLENLLMRQQIILMAQRTNFNDILIPSQLFVREKQFVVFPSLDVKKVGELQPKPTALRKQKQRNQNLEFRLQDIRKEYHSNILGNLQSQSPDLGTPIHWNSQRKIESPTEIRKSTMIPKTIKKTSIIYKSNPKVQKQESPEKIIRENPEPNFSILSRIRSQAQIQATLIKQTVTKKYKKGYLFYSTGGPQYWKSITQNLSKPCKITADNRILTAKIFFGIDLVSLEPLVCQKADQQIEIASLSKIMTCFLSILIAKKYQVNLKEYTFRVPDWITQTPGTSAQLQAGDTLSAFDLLFALMLPSGNDASICLAQLMGKVLQRHRKSDQKKSFTDLFLAHMNAFSKQLDLPQQWGNSSGLSSNPNLCTAQSIVALAALALKEQLFSKIVNTQQYEANFRNDRYGLSRKKVWKNTNKLLERGWQGVKTGTTQSAGHCLMALHNNKLLGVFDCQTLSKRFSDAIKLSDFIENHIL